MRWTILTQSTVWNTCCCLRYALVAYFLVRMGYFQMNALEFAFEESFVRLVGHGQTNVAGECGRF